ncbi:MAG: hypothetical protein ACE5H9_21335 [Anaerolineae bacterium]
MPGIVIQELPERLHQKLEERAMKNRRSLAEEIKALLEMALNIERPEGTAPPPPYRGRFLLTDQWIDQARREGRR